jgi:hypothetical protein
MTRRAADDRGLIAFLGDRLDEDERYLESNQHHLWTQRPLREVEAKRKILAEHKAVTRLATLTEQELGFLGWYREWVLKNLAAIYSDHPDYRPEWASP